MKLYKKVSIVFTIIIFLIFLLQTKSNAILQASGRTVATKTINDWIVQVRKMEEAKGVFGLEETLKSNLTPNEEPNDIDVHMEKNTEYGAIAILSASQYGKPEAIINDDTTTGNETGVVIKINKEIVSAGEIAYAGNYVSAHVKYKDNYTSSYIYKAGDAITETRGWHGSTESSWFGGSSGQDYYRSDISNTRATLLRAYSGSIFSYNGYAGYWYGYDSKPQDNSDAEYSRAHPTRCIVICGEGV